MEVAYPFQCLGAKRWELCGQDLVCPCERAKLALLAGQGSRAP